jgi:hypothetical protein
MALVFLRSVHRLLVRFNFVSSSPILVALIMEALSSSQTSVLTRATRRNNPENGILHVFQCSVALPEHQIDGKIMHQQM